ncbi:penicillin acylase family protein [Nocardioides sp. WS12]|uniref:penicillin acylase family protein n=1 Tax=Nocardioides sp. WS12 TaxID=2486272 RepID=UPI0015FB070F|nr:penicillin acylase family protein [Nocardioides sp. WS12]
MTITRDAWGIPHVQAGSVLELAREQGRATAEDRPWQLEVERRRASGTCAEVFGPAALEWDLLARRALIVDTARRAYAALSEESAAFFSAYVDGLNEVLSRKWEVWTPLAVFATQHLLFSTFPSKLWRDHVLDTAGPEAAECIDLFRTEGLPGGSNAFAVSGTLTESGLPIVVGDPHRVIEAPGCYAQVRLVCTDPDDAFDVSGLTFVGVPGIQHFGHAGSVAWGITNAVADTDDVYDEDLVRRGDAVLARGTAGWAPVARRVELVRVRTGDETFEAHEVEVLVTDRGPVILGGPDADVAVSLRTPPSVLGDLGLDAILPLLRSRTAADVTAAFDGWVAPVNNLMVADTTGHVEHRVVGRVPERATGAPRPRNRRTSTKKPAHFVPTWVTDLPSTTGSILVSANDRATPEFARIGDDFARPFRADRIRERLTQLAASGPLTPEALASVLADVKQTAGAALLDTIAQLVDLDGPADALRTRLLGWDREMASDSVDAALFAAVRAAAVDGFAAAPVLDGVDSSPYGDLFAPWFDLRGRIRLALPSLLLADKPLGVDPLQVVAAALDQVAHQPEPSAWGTRHVAVPLTPHEQFGLAAPAGSAAPMPYLAGDEDCVLATRALGGIGPCVHGPVARFVWDLAGDSRWVVPLGASGNPVSPHHHDQQQTWAAGGTLPLTGPAPRGEDR